MAEKSIPLIDRFWNFVSPEPNTGCWLWTGHCMKDGYGQFGIKATEVLLAHRAAYKFFVGPIPDGLELDHLCKTRCCVNPRHLEPVTHLENIRRGDAGVVRIAINASITLCPQGHDYSPENTRISWCKYGTSEKLYPCRNCRECARIRNREYYLRHSTALKSAASLAAAGTEIISPSAVEAAEFQDSRP